MNFFAMGPQVHCHLDDYQVPADDNTVKSLRRLQQLVPHMRKISTAIRVAEGYLSPSQIGEPRKPLTGENWLQHQLAKSQQGLQMFGGRPARAAAWMNFTKEIADTVNSKASSSAAAAIVEFRPSFVKDPETGHRRYQILVFRCHTVAPIQLGICEQVWRFSSNRGPQTGKRTAGFKPFGGTVPAELCAGVHIRILEPSTQANGFFATLQQATVFLDTHVTDKGSPIILCEVPEANYKIKENAVAVFFELGDEAMRLLQRAEGMDFAVKSGGGCSESVFTYTSFFPTKEGRASMQAYMEELRGIYKRTMAKDIVDASGCVSLKTGSGSQVHLRWRDLVLRLPGYFDVLLRPKAVSGAKAKLSSEEFSKGVWAKFAAVAPTSTARVQPFFSFLKAIGDLSPELLPTT